MLTALIPATETAGLDPIRMSPVAWILAGLFLLAAVFLMIRLLEFDLINEETPDQDDPLP